MKNPLIIFYIFSTCLIVVAQQSGIPRDTYLARKYISYNNKKQDSGTLNYLLEAIGTSKYARIQLDNGAWLITNNLTVPTNVALEFARGSYLANPEDYTVTINTIQYDSVWTNEMSCHVINVENADIDTVTADSELTKSTKVGDIVITNSFIVDGADFDGAIIENVIWTTTSPVYSYTINGISISNNSSVILSGLGNITVTASSNVISILDGDPDIQSNDLNRWVYTLPFFGTGDNVYNESVSFNLTDKLWTDGRQRKYDYTYLRAVLIAGGGDGGSGSTKGYLSSSSGTGGGGGGGGGFVEVSDYPVTNGILISLLISETSSLLSVNGEWAAYATHGSNGQDGVGLWYEGRAKGAKGGTGGVGIIRNSEYLGVVNNGGNGGIAPAQKQSPNAGQPGGGGGAVGWFFGRGGNGGGAGNTNDTYVHYAGFGGGGINGNDAVVLETNYAIIHDPNYPCSAGSGSAGKSYYTFTGTNIIGTNIGIGALQIITNTLLGLVVSNDYVDQYNQVVSSNPLYAAFLNQASYNFGTNKDWKTLLDLVSPPWNLKELFIYPGKDAITNGSSEDSYSLYGAGGAGGLGFYWYENPTNGLDSAGGGGGGGASGGNPPLGVTWGFDGGSCRTWGGGGGGGNGTLYQAPGNGGSGGRPIIILYFR